MAATDNTLSIQNLWALGDAGYHTYRIPAILNAGGTLLAFAEARKHGPADDGKIDMVLRRSTDGGRTWSPQQLVHSDPGDDVSIGNPCPVYDARTGRVILICVRNARSVLMFVTGDQGKTWDGPRDITSQANEPAWVWSAAGPGIGIQMRHHGHAGRLVIPFNHRPFEDVTPPADWTREWMLKQDSTSHAIFSDDGGATWRRSGRIGAGSNESQVVEVSDGRLMLNARMQRHGRNRRATSISSDGGATWSPITHDQTLLDPICQASILRLTWPDGDGNADGRSRLLFSNPATEKARRNMTVRLSYDEGQSWPIGRTIFEGHAGYSCLAAADDGTLLCLFECGDANYRERIALARFDLAWLTDGADVLP